MVPTATLAVSTSAAERYVSEILGVVDRIINTRKSDAQMLREFEAMLAGYGDMPVIARAVLGAPARSLSDAQMREFTFAFQGYLSRKYGRQFQRFIGSDISIQSSRDLGGNKGVMVETYVVFVAEPPFTVHWWVSDRSGATKMVDMVIEGISMLSSEREEMRALYERFNGDMDRLNAHLHAS